MEGAERIWNTRSFGIIPRQLLTDESLMKFTKNISLVSLLATAALLAASCATDKEPAGGVVKTFPAKKLADPKIDESLKPGTPANNFQVTEAKSSLITLKKKALGDIFLMSITLSTSDNAARPNVLLPKVVSFETNGSELALKEQNNFSIYDEVPTDKLLQTFPIESQDEENISFKWNYGLVSAPTKGFYVVSDDPEGTKEQVDPNEEVLPAVASFLKFAKIKDNRLELRQLSRVRGGEAVMDEKTKKISMSTKETSVQLDIAFAPYVENKRFQPRISTKQNGVGFFEIAKIRKSEGPIDILASRWDLSKEAGPITYAISKTTPPEAVEAMKEGVLYWNQVSQAALGYDIIKVETDADPQQPPRARTVFVYWVPYSGAGSAYANFQPDPLTGEITSGLVYQTSVFYLSGKQRGRRFVNRGVENKVVKAINPAGFQSAAICDFQDPAIMADPLVEGIDEKISMKMGLDYLRHVVAHEVGHTLGLRHNWAGSLASELTTPAESREKFKEYLNDEKSTGAMVSSSVMEYTTYRDSLMEGAAIGAKKFMAYDKAAIEWAYGEKVVKGDDIKAPYFCTDVEGGAGKTFGCSTTDSGPHPIAGHAAGVARNRALLADFILESLLDPIRPDNEADQLSVARALAAAHPDKISNTGGPELPLFISLGSAGVKAIPVDRAKKGLNWTNEKEYAEETMAFIAKEFNDAGGLPGILKVAYGLDDNFKVKAGWLLEEVRAKTGAATFGRGKTLEGKPYELNETEIKEVKAASEKLAVAVENAFLRDGLIAVTGLTPSAVHQSSGKTTPAALVNYEGSKSFAPYVVQDSWQPGLAAIAEGVATESEGETEGTVDGAAVKVPNAKFNLDVRMSAMRLFSPKVFGGRTSETWMKEQEEKLAKALVERLAPVIKVNDGNPDKTEPAGKAISKELLEWAKKELSVLKALKAAKPAPMPVDE